MERPAYPVNDHIQFGLFTGRVYHPEQAYDHPPLPTPQINQPQEEPDTHQNVDPVYEEDTILDDQNHQLIPPPANPSIDTHNPFA